MSNPYSHIERYLRQKLQFLTPESSDDWDVFERKLERALWWQRYQLIMGMALVAGLLFLSYQMAELPEVSRRPAFNPEVVLPPLQPVSDAHDDREKAPNLNPSHTEMKQAAAVMAMAGHGKPNKSQASANANARNTGHDAISTRERAGVASVLKTRSVHIAPESFRPKIQPVITKPRVVYVPGEITYEGLKLEQPLIKDSMQAPPMPVYLSPYDKQEPWIFSFSVQPSFTYRKFTTDQDRKSFIHQDFINAVERAESHGLSLNAGIIASGRVGAITFINFGAQWVSYNNKASFSFMKFRDEHINTLTGEITHYTIRDDAEKISFVDDNYYRYLNFPLSVSHRPWLNEHLRLNLQTGVSLMRFVSAEGKNLDFKTLDIIDISQRNFQPWITSFEVKMGLRYYVSEQMNFGIEPTFSFISGTIFSESYPFKVVPYAAGANLSLELKLN